MTKRPENRSKPFKNRVNVTILIKIEIVIEPPTDVTNRLKQSTSMYAKVVRKIYNRAMSLFKAKEWWRMTTSTQEECDTGCLCITSIDNTENGKIIVGSYHGILHIYSPSESDKNAHDVLLESHLQGPILQIAVGKFVSVSTENHLAVLLSRSVTIYALAVKEGAVDHGNQCIMNKIYEHKLERTAANMTHGPFGGVKDRDFICVQSMDGTLSIYESENFTFMRFIPGFLIPGPLVYCEKIDSFITVSSNRCLEAYSYQSLAVAVDSSTKEESQTITTGKKIIADWKLIIGEGALDIKVVDIPNGSPVIMILGERNLFCVQETGQFKYMKKLEYNPACFYPYVAEGSHKVNCLVCTHSKQLLVYEGISLKWASLLEETPVQIALGSFNGISGMIVTLTDQCHTTCSYLGTHPSMFHLPKSTQRELDYDAVNEEMKKLNSKIKKLHSSKGDVLSQTKESDDLSIKVDVQQTLDRTSVSSQHDAAMTSGGFPPSISAQVILKVTRRVTNVQVTIHVNEPLACSQTHISIPSIAESDPSPCLSVSFFLKKEFSPSTLDFEVMVHYDQVSGVSKAVNETARLPLNLVVLPSDPIKTLDKKITLETNKTCMNLLELFPELTAADAGPTCVGSKLIHGPCTTILTSKTSNRYRIQSETYAGLWLMTDELVRRIKKAHSVSDLKIVFSQPPGLDDIGMLIDRHFGLRISKENVKLMLEQRSKQFRAIQKRLLTRFKDKTPAPLNCLDTLLEGTYRQILALADASEENRQTLDMSSTELSSALRLFILLTQLWLSLSSEEVQMLQSILCIDMKYSDVGWEETVDCSLTTNLRTVLSSRGAKDQGTMPLAPQVILEMPEDTTKVKKHLALLFDRLSKGARLLPSKSYNSVTNQSITNAGPISNISITQSPKKSGTPANANHHQSLPLARGVSKDTILDEGDENQEALINEILGSAPKSILPESLHLIPSKNLEQRGSDFDDNKGPTIPSSFPSYNGDDILNTNTEEEPVPMIKANIPHKVEDLGLNEDDIIESPAFYDNSNEDILSM